MYNSSDEYLLKEKFEHILYLWNMIWAAINALCCTFAFAYIFLLNILIALYILYNSRNSCLNDSSLDNFDNIKLLQSFLVK